MMIPVAQTEKLLIQEVGNELVVYDQETNSSHCLTPVAATVWYLCNGQNTVDDIARLLEQELNLSADAGVDVKGLVYLTLEELEQHRLIKQYSSHYSREPGAVSTISRRKLVKTATLVGGFAVGSMFPLVKSIVAPTPAMASSSSTMSGTGDQSTSGFGNNSSTLSSNDPSSTDLSSNDLSGRDLSGMDLSGANLSGKNLSGANLSGANLSGANLSRTNLSSANLSSTNLSSANLNRANLRNANLTNANLTDANLNRADLTGTNLSGAQGVA